MFDSDERFPLKKKQTIGRRIHKDFQLLGSKKKPKCNNKMAGINNNNNKSQKQKYKKN